MQFSRCPTGPADVCSLCCLAQKVSRVDVADAVYAKQASVRGVVHAALVWDCKYLCFSDNDLPPTIHPIRLNTDAPPPSSCRLPQELVLLEATGHRPTVDDDCLICVAQGCR